MIQAAYRACARQHHPDIAPGPEAQHRMALLNAAYAILRDPEARAAWDAAHRPPAPTWQGVSRPHVTTVRTDPATGASCTWMRGPEGVGAAGPPPGRPSGSVLMFGRHLCWSIGEIARVDPGYLQWLADRPEGRPYRDEIQAVLQPIKRSWTRTATPDAAEGTTRRRPSIWRR